MKIRLAVLFSVIIISAFMGMIWFREEISPVSEKKSPTELFIITKGESVRSIATRLEQERIIRSSLAFFLLVRVEGLAKKIQAGNFRLSPSMDAYTIAQSLTLGTTDVRITTLEGWRKEEIALELTRKLAIPEKEFLKYAEEGYMFPDTYLIPKDASASAIAAIFKKNFNRRVDEKIKAEASRKGLTLDELITLASIVERETKQGKDQSIVAGILIKRWQNDWPIQADATIQYALGYQPKEKRWWKKNLTADDLKIDSSYNTYLNPGLPPGPIANPSLASIRAIISPKETDYWYYLSDSFGRVHYAKTLEEHQKNIERYLR